MFKVYAQKNKKSLALTELGFERYLTQATTRDVGVSGLGLRALGFLGFRGFRCLGGRGDFASFALGLSFRVLGFYLVLWLL